MMSAPVRILVTDAEQRSALAVVRSLGRAGHHVHICSFRRRPLAGASRYVRGQVVAPDPAVRPNDYVNRIANYRAEHDIQIIVPIADPSLLALLPRSGPLGDAQIPFPEFKIFQAISDKAHLTNAAAQLGIQIPKQVVVKQPGTKPVLADSKMSFPLVVKPRRSIAHVDGRAIKQTVRYAWNAADLESILAGFAAPTYPILLQEKIVGPGTGIFLLRWNGRTVARFAHQRIREKPPSGGVSTCCESVRADPDLHEQSERLLEQFNWCGPAMVEYKRDFRTGREYLMEINGRFWGSLQLAIDAGVDFPALLIELALGHEPAAAYDYRTGVQLHWWWGEVDHVISRVRGNKPAFRASACNSRAPDLTMRRRFHIGRRYDSTFRWRDPRPFLRETRDWVAALFRTSLDR